MTVGISRRRPEPPARSVDEWAAHWNLRGQIDNEVARNGMCIDGVPIDAALHRAAVIDPIVERLALERWHEVLEVGCGSGLILREIERRVRRAVGVDVSAGMLRGYAGAAELHVLAAHELSFAPERFDRVLLNSVSHYFPSLDYFRRVVADLVRMLRPPGLLLIGDVLIGPQRAGTPYRSYDPLDLIETFEQLEVHFSIESQPSLKRAINRRYDIVVQRDGAVALKAHARAADANR